MNNNQLIASNYSSVDEFTAYDSYLASINDGDEECFGFGIPPHSETIENQYDDHQQQQRQVPIASITAGASWQRRKKEINYFLQNQVLLKDDVLLSRTDLKSIATLMEGTTKYRRDVLAQRMMYAECNGFNPIEQRAMVTEIQNNVLLEGGRFIIIQEGKDGQGTKQEHLLCATPKQSFEMITRDLTSSKHPFPSMEESLPEDDQVDLPQQVAKAEAKAKKQKEKRKGTKNNAGQDNNKKSRRVVVGGSATAGIVPDQTTSQSSFTATAFPFPSSNPTAHPTTTISSTQAAIIPNVGDASLDFLAAELGGLSI